MRDRQILPVLFTFILAMSAVLCVVSSEAEENSLRTTDTYQQSLTKWKAALVANRKQNWIPLAGLYWLKDGANGFGSDESDPIVLPKGTAPAHAGVFTLHGGKVTVEFAPGVVARIDGKKIDGKETDQKTTDQKTTGDNRTSAAIPLHSDAADKPTVLEIGTLQMHVIQRGSRIGIRVKDLNSAAAKNYQGPIFYPVNMAYRVTARWLPSNGKQMVNVPDVLGDITPVPSAGTAVFTIDGHEYQLTDLGGEATGGLSFVFNDLTKKTDTYPGGRFLDTGPVVNGTVVIDFNQAYNPPCSVTPYATCPLAPPENRLQVAIPAGEKYDRKHAYYHHAE